jgi:AcrR family transcriptional regulator
VSYYSGGALRFVKRFLMGLSEPDLETFSQRPKRADAQRNHGKLLDAARAAFTEADADASLEDIARRAGVGIGTLYRHFPTRQVLIEAVYIDEVEALSRSARDVAELPPWQALTAWLRRYVEYVATKQALANELFAEGASSEVFANCRSALYTAGGPLLERAQQARIVRPDVTIADVLHLISGVAKVSATNREQSELILEVALDGLRYVQPVD